MVPPETAEILGFSPECPPAPDQLKKKFEPEEPDRAWLAEMAELGTPEGKLYLATLEDISAAARLWGM